METPQQLARPTSDEDWQPYYATIRKLWWDEDRTLTDVANVMRADHGFHATYVPVPPRCLAPGF